MKKIYQSPCTSVYVVMSQAPLMVSMKVGSSDEKVQSTSDIGFTKGDNSSWSNIWEE